MPTQIRGCFFVGLGAANLDMRAYTNEELIWKELKGVSVSLCISCRASEAKRQKH